MKLPDILKRRRRRRRLRHGCALEDRAITSRTRGRYFSAVSRLMQEVDLGTNVDEQVAQWVEAKYSEGESITLISDALCGLQHYSNGLKGQLAHSWRLFKVWRKVEKPKQAPPLPLPFLLAMVARALELHKLELALCLILGFWGMLRTGEILDLRPQQILIGKRDIVLRLGLTKTGLRQAVDENVLITDAAAWLICNSYLDTTPSSTQRIWNETPAAFRSEFKQLVTFFKLSATFKPYSLRRGGATHDFRSHGLMEHTRLRGRWSTTSAARQYVQEGLSALTEIKISKQSHALVQRYHKLFA